ncbi:protein kinase domain-containing protein [Zafaria sp. Z1313]|uniref:serine/threonine-protein kinase n=1 Tax=unclassified Zafaria TaxID=2828765 RepID=UPI002E75FA79|nr:protein kinase [Zafaria sp. J156]MEE1620261.1 protein kinase [Zafaria sp. J156]
MNATIPLLPLPRTAGFETLREIGRGGNAAVYEVLSGAGGTRLALKVGAAEDPPGVEQLEREVEVLRGLGHPHLVALHSAVETSRGPGVLMEYLPGGSVAELVAASGPRSLGETVTVVAPIAQALAFLHAAGAVHGDVSPGNILFTATGVPKLSDLGLAGLVGRPGQGGGTPGFTAPEPQSARDRALLPARDVYSLAAVAWFVLTGRTPAPTSRRPPLGSLVPGVPDEFALLLEACLAEDPDERPPASELALGIFCGAEPRPVELTESVRPEAMGLLPTRRPPEPGPRGPGAVLRRLDAAWTPRKTAWLAGAAAAVVLAVAAAGAVTVAFRDMDNGPAPAAQSPAPGTATTAPSEEGARAGDPPGSPGTEAGAVPEAGAAPRSGGSAEASATPTRAPAEAAGEVPDDPADAAVVLAGRRDAALSAADAGALEGVHAADGESLGDDAEAVRELRRQGLRYSGLRTVLSGVRQEEAPGGGSAVVRAESRIGPYAVVDEDGETVEAVDAGIEQRIVLHLERTADGWRIARVEQDGTGT